MNGQVNRAAQLWQNWEEKEKMLREVFGRKPPSENFNKQRYEFLSRGMDRISKDITPDEKLVLGLIKKATARLEKELYPNRLLRLVRKVKRVLYDKPRAASKLKGMKEDNIRSLNQALSGLGFDAEKLNLNKILDFERREINLNMATSYGVDHNFKVQLHLEKGADGMYQLQGYTGTLKNPNEPDGGKSCRFDAGTNINALEAVNLLQGRAVMKNFQIGENRMASKWVQLDLASDGKPALKEVDANHEFNIRQEITKVEQVLDKPELYSTKVLRGMEKGNQVALKHVSGGTTYLEADPLAKRILIRNERQQPVTLDKLKKEKESVIKLEQEKTRSRVKKIQLTKQQGKSMGIT